MRVRPKIVLRVRSPPAATPPLLHYSVHFSGRVGGGGWKRARASERSAVGRARRRRRVAGCLAAGGAAGWWPADAVDCSGGGRGHECEHGGDQREATVPHQLGGSGKAAVAASQPRPASAMASVAGGTGRRAGSPLPAGGRAAARWRLGGGGRRAQARCWRRQAAAATAGWWAGTRCSSWRPGDGRSWTWPAAAAAAAAGGSGGGRRRQRVGNRKKRRKNVYSISPRLLSLLLRPLLLES